MKYQVLFTSKNDERCCKICSRLQWCLGAFVVKIVKLIIFVCSCLLGLITMYGGSAACTWGIKTICAAKSACV